MTNYTQYVKDAHNSGEINEYMAQKLLKAIESGITNDIFEHAIEDAKHATKHNIESDDDYNLRFLILTLADDIMDDTFGRKVSGDEKNDLCKYIIVSRKNGADLKDLVDLRVLLYNWLRDRHTKKAYPNTYGKDTRDPTYDRYKWTDTVKVIYSLMQNKNINRDTAIKLATVDWNEDERFKFTNWLKYYESGNTEKYNVKTAESNDIYDLGLPAHLLNPDTRSNNIEERPTSAYKLRKEKTRREEELERAHNYKQKMKSRLRSLRSLLDKYNSVLPSHNIEQIQDEMYALDKSISKLNVYANMEDRIIRAANKIEKFGFKEGAEILNKFAEDPAAPDQPNEKVVVEALPPQLEPPKPPPVPSVDLNMIIQRLEGITRMLKSRDLIRDLASADILLNEIGMGSLFNEISDSQSKLIEAFSYASNRIDGVLSKLRGSGKLVPKHPAAKERQQMPQNIDKRELGTKPIGKMQKELPTK